MLIDFLLFFGFFYVATWTQYFISLIRVRKVICRSTKYIQNRDDKSLKRLLGYAAIIEKYSAHDLQYGRSEDYNVKCAQRLLEKFYDISARKCHDVWSVLFGITAARHLLMSPSYILYAAGADVKHTRRLIANIIGVVLYAIILFLLKPCGMISDLITMLPSILS